MTVTTTTTNKDSPASELDATSLDPFFVAVVCRRRVSEDPAECLDLPTRNSRRLDRRRRRDRVSRVTVDQDAFESRVHDRAERFCSTRVPGSSGDAQGCRLAVFHRPRI